MLDYPLGGIALFFSGVRPYSAAWFEIRLPNRLSEEMVAGMIYANIARAFPEDAPIWKRHFQNLKLPLFSREPQIPSTPPTRPGRYEYEIHVGADEVQDVAGTNEVVEVDGAVLGEDEMSPRTM